MQDYKQGTSKELGQKVWKKSSKELAYKVCKKSSKEQCKNVWKKKERGKKVCKKEARN